MHAPTSNPLIADLPDIAADILARLRERKPRVHCITNTVAQASRPMCCWPRARCRP